MRLGNDIENNANSIFFTLTYNNKYIPFAVLDDLSELCDSRYEVNHPDNIRFDGVKDVRRNEEFTAIYSNTPVPVTSFHRSDVLPYLSKRDIQLWFKMVRKGIHNNFEKYDISQYIRYFIVGEYGPTKYRPHYHGVIICDSHEVSEYLIERGLYENWSMCDKTLFDKYTHYCDSGARSYVTQYLTGYSNLPKVYQNKEIKPFRLASKAPSTGNSAFDFKKVFEDVSNGVIEYLRTIERLGEQHILVYPEEVGNSLFPKCYRFSELSFDGLYRVYSRLYTIKRKFPRLDSRSTFRRLYPNLHAGDINAAVACDKWCTQFGITPFRYVDTLVRYYYLRQMRVLKSWYQNMDLSLHSNILFSYVNFQSIVNLYKSGALSDLQIKRYNVMLEPFGVELCMFDDFTYGQISDFCKYRPSIDYVNNVSDIIASMEKMPKYNLLTNNFPHII